MQVHKHKYCPAVVTTTKEHMTQVRQGVRLTKPKGTVAKQQPEDKEPEKMEWNLLIMTRVTN